MKKVTILCLASLAMSGSSLLAQAPSHPQYVPMWEQGDEFATLYEAWAPGRTLTKKDGGLNDEFFVSRVRPRTRFTERDTQVDQSLTEGRKVLWWVPIGTSQWNALPSYYFNSEVFSTWSYIDHWGNWTAPYLRLPAAFTDVAHKNGVSVSATSPVAFGAKVNYYGGEGKKYYAVIQGGTAKYLNYLRYYGIDGAGYNSEFSFDSYLNERMKDFLAQMGKDAQAQGFDLYSNVWYSLTGNSGDISGSWDVLYNRNSNWFHYKNGVVSTHFFLNYNWNQSYLTTSKQEAQKFGRSPYDVYAGINMQAGTLPRNGWELIKNNEVSIGIWGAHNANMIFENRGGVGGNILRQQQEYQLASEYIFTGGKHNPISHHALGSTLPGSSRSAANFAGISAFVTARSAMHGDLSQEPFVTYLNLGNGTYFNLEGEPKFAGEWYNLGMQDFMPTWRWWFSKTFMGRTEDAMPKKSLKAEFTWADAWFGGSCLEISGEEQGEQYLQLFKTKYALQQGDKLTIRYKLVSGKGDLDWANYATGEADEHSAEILRSDDIEYDTWKEKVVEISTGVRNLNMTGKTLGMIGLRFSNTTADFKIRIGEIALTRGEYKQPQTPKIKAHVVLENNYRGHDFKLIYSMGEPKTDGAVTYNDEVDTWYYKVYSQQEGEAVEFCTATTSWAAYVVGAKLNLSGEKKVRYGVSAVSLDGKKESEIAWTEYVDLKPSTIVDGITADRTTVNKGEKVIVTFEDERHDPATKWTAYLNGQEVASATATNQFEFTPTEIGGYDIVCLLANGQSVKKPSMISVVPVSAGTTPQILTLTANGKTDAEVANKFEVKPDTEVTMAFTSNKSKGAVSRALRIQDNTFKIPNIYQNLGIRLGNGGTDADGMTLSFWVRPMRTEYASGEDGVRFMDISKPSESWPMSEWCYFWVNYGTGWATNERPRQPIEGFVWTNMKTGYNNQAAREKFQDVEKLYKLEAGVWYHFTVSLAYDLSAKLYINGEKIGETQRPGSARSNTYRSGFDLNISRYAKFGYALDAFIDEVRVYGRVLSDEEVKGTMKHLDNPSGENGLRAYFDFENEPLASGDIRSAVGEHVTGHLTGLTWKGEGNQAWEKATVPPFGPSNGWVVGDTYPIETTASWSAKKAQISGTTNDDTSGSAKAQWSALGVYPVTLTLENAWGKDTKTFNVINVVKTPSSVEAVEMLDLTVYPNPFVEDVRLRFAEAGRYDVALYDLSGRLVSRSAVVAEAASFHTLHVDAPSGLYLMRVAREGKVITTVKLQKR